tara:strand:- start:670 stop:1332 length:663 start_codon:yes stop_codon:yes gene_type:complete
LKKLNNKIITIDGPSASGKGLLSRSLAKKMSYRLLDSGLLYRAYSYCLVRYKDHNKALKNFSLLIFDDSNASIKVYESDADITARLRSEEIALLASEFSQERETRDNLIKIQRSFINDVGLIADGRDMGTIVFPEAGIKFFLTANSEVRAKRRYLELQKVNQEVNMRDLIEDIENRDKADTSRLLSPLIPAKDSIVIDSSFLSPQEVLSRVLQTLGNKGI